MMDSTRRVAKLEALLARVQSRASAVDRGALRSASAAVSIAPAAKAAPAPAPVGLRPVGAVQAKPAPAPAPAPSPKPAPVVNKTPSVPPSQDDAPTAIHSVDVQAIDSLAASADAATTRNATPVAAAAPAPAPAAPPPAAGTPAAAAAPAFRGVSALGALSKKATLIGTAPPANWPPRQSDAPPAAEAKAPSAPPPAPEEPAVVVADAPPPAPEPETSAGDVDALLGKEEAPAPIEEAPAKPTFAETPKPAPIAAREAEPAPIARRAQEDLEPVVEKTAKPARKMSTVIALVVIWLLVLAVFWVVYKGSFR